MLRLVPLSLLLLLVGSAAHAVEFWDLGADVRARRMNADGTYAAGDVLEEGFWVPARLDLSVVLASSPPTAPPTNDWVKALYAESPGTPSSYGDGRAISSDGTVVVGDYYGDEHYYDGKAIKWTAATDTFKNLNADLGNPTESLAIGVSPDGTIVVGTAGDDGFVLVGNDPVDLVPDSKRFKAVTDAENGSFVLVGLNDSDVPARWTSDGENYTLDTGFSSDLTAFMLANPGLNLTGEGKANRVSEGGNTVTGGLHWYDPVSEDSGSYAFRWTDSGGFQNISPAGANKVDASSMSPDGSIVGGGNYNRGGTPEEHRGRAFVWDQEYGSRLVSDILQGEVDLTGWTLDSALVSGDGKTLIGIGTKDGVQHTWMAQLDSGSGVPAPSGLVGLIGLALVGLIAALRRRLLKA